MTNEDNIFENYKILKEALKKVVDWNCHSLTLDATQGQNGVRDFYRFKIANAALLKVNERKEK